jgi:DNA-binding NarL/FixJ family response regulator
VENPIRVLVVDDHFVVRKGVCSLLAADGGIVVAGEAADGRQAIDEARRLAPQVVLMDLRMPGLGGVEATRAILAEQPGVSIVVLSGIGMEDEVLAAIQAGAVGYLDKAAAPQEDFLAAIHRVAAGDCWLPAHLTRRLSAHHEPQPPANGLTARERDVLGLLARGWSNHRIAGELHIAEITVRTHVRHLFDKLGVANRVEAALLALRAGLVQLDEPSPEAAGRRA